MDALGSRPGSAWEAVGPGASLFTSVLRFLICKVRGAAYPICLRRKNTGGTCQLLVVSEMATLVSGTH